MYRGTTHFHEIQRLREPVLVLIVVFMALVGWFLLVYHVILNKPLGTDTPSDRFIVVFWFGSSLWLPILLLWFFKLEVTVDLVNLRVQIWPFFNREIGGFEIDQFYARTYRPIVEYRGWMRTKGIRANFAYTISGNEGVQLVMSDGSRVLIGSNRMHELEAAIATLTGRSPFRGSS